MAGPLGPGQPGGSGSWQVALPERTLAQSSASRRSPANLSRLLKKILTNRSKSASLSAFDHHGPPGLTTLFTPSDPLTEYVFVHGLGGGSTRTWCLNPDPSSFWPREWLPRQAGFRNVRVHTFGYNSNWKEKGLSTVDVHDFGQALLLAMRNSPAFSTDNPILFVAHSMGGIVVKEAYLLARQDPACHTFASRMAAMVFLATPHRGSDYATVLNNIVRLSAAHGPRQYISSIERCSSSLVRINDAFRHFSNDLILYSYFETKELSLGIGGSLLVVQKDSAVTGLPGERVSMMDADHRSICKFTSPDDPNYVVLTDALANINRELSRRLSTKNSELLWEQMQRIEAFLGMPEVPEDDLKDLEDIRMPGSCEWFTDRAQFQTWMDSTVSDGPKVFWVYAKPATGKSVLASYIISATDDFNVDCSYYFFRHGDKIRSTLAGCLLSLAYQMSTRNKHVRQRLLLMIDRGVRYEKENPKSIWRKIFEPMLSDSITTQPQFWIIDALDECVDIAAFFNIFLKMDRSFPIKILVTSRQTEEIAAGFGEMKHMSGLTPLFSTEIQQGDTREPILLYLNNNKRKLHVGTEEERERLITRILDKSQGCFLWVRLVLEELSTVWTTKQVEQVFEDVPQEMDLLYSRALHLVGARPAHSISIAAAILTWTVCAIRPMTVEELQCALQMDIGTTVQDPDQAIPSLCSQLIHVDSNGRVLMVHLTAKTFLQNQGLASPVAICPIIGHRRIAAVCLKFLVSDEMKPQTGRRSSGRKRPLQQRSTFLAYASFNFAEHLRRTTSNNTVLEPLLYEMLQKNVFTWIEAVARSNNLQVLTRTANLIKNYYQRQLKYFPPLSERVQLANSWAVDLHRLVAKFGNHLVRQPASIYSLVPPFCPRQSAVAAVFGTPAKRIQVVGLEGTGWDDRLACIDSHDTQAYAVAAGENYFAVGFGSSVALFHTTTCQKWMALDHGSPIRALGFDATGNLLISTGRRDVKIWDLEGNAIRGTFNVEFDILTLSLRNEGDGLVIALKNNSTVRLSLDTGAVTSDVQWKSAFEDEGKFRRPPLLAAFSPDESLLAVAYRGRPIMIWDPEENELCGFVSRETQDLETLALGTNTSPSSLVFNPEEMIPLLAAAYEDGDLCLFNHDELRLIKVIEANAQVVASSHDGTILATGNAAGMVQLLEFETLQLLFRVNAADYGIRCLAFTSDNSRFLDVRGTRCNVWEPALPSGKSRMDDASSNCEPQEPRIVGLSDGEVEITRVAVADSDWFFLGKSDGSVWLYHTSDGKPRRLLYRHGFQISVTRLIWGNSQGLLVSADAAGRFIVCNIERDGKGGFRDPVRRLDIKGPVHGKIAIWQVLLNKANDLLLVSTMKSDVVWDVSQAKAISSIQFASRDPFDWVNNPSDDSERFLVGTEGAEAWDWPTCKLKTSNHELRLPPEAVLSSSQAVKSTSQAFDTKIVVEYSQQGGESATTSTLLLELTEVNDSRSLELSQAFARATAGMLHLIGTSQSRIIFLDKELRICSVAAVAKPKQGFQVTSHFFIPADWYSQRRSLRTLVTEKGDILFVRTEEVAVIKYGMAFEDAKWDFAEE